MDCGGVKPVIHITHLSSPMPCSTGNLTDLSNIKLIIEIYVIANNLSHLYASLSLRNICISRLQIFG
jgi:hypothetical protein